MCARSPTNWEFTPRRSAGWSTTAGSTPFVWGGCCGSRADRSTAFSRGNESSRFAAGSRLFPAWAEKTHLVCILREVGVVGERTATREHAVRFRQGLEELGTTCVKLGQLLSSRRDLLPDVYIDELGKTLSQAEEIARTLDPKMDPVALLRSEGLSVMAQEAQRRLEPNQLLAFSFTQLQPLLRMPRSS